MTTVLAGSSSWLRFVAALALAASAVPATAQNIGDYVAVHGFGNWAYAETDGNRYDLGTGDGAWDNANFALNVTATPVDRLDIVGQIRFEAVGGEDEVELDYAFAGWTFNDAAQLRVGRVKHPFGTYGEVFDVGTLRPLFTLPQSVYGPNGLTARAYNGVGLTGRFGWSSGWDLQYDVYAGQIEGEFTVSGLAIPSFPLPIADLGFEVDDTIGGRLTLYTPVHGLDFGVSFYRGDESADVGAGRESTFTKKVYLVTIEYLTDRWSARSEWATSESGDRLDQDGGYVEIGYMINAEWQVAARWEQFEFDIPGLDFSFFPPFYTQLTEHEDVTVGVSYWFNPSLVLRLNYHQVTGNRYAYPDSFEELGLIGAGIAELEEDTEMFLFGAQFSF